MLIGTRTVPALGAGAGSAGSTTVTLPSAIGTGTFFIIAKANADDGIVETQTGNNALARAIAIGSDLWVSALTAPAKAAAGSALFAAARKGA